MRDGFSLVDLILAIGIIATLFGGIFLVYFSIVDAALNFEVRHAAAAILSQKVELVRDLPYEQIGTTGGIPAGVLPQSEQVSWDGKLFVVDAAVRNVDDPFDGTVSSAPADTAPADYKLVEFVVSCPTCARFTPVSITTTAAPRSLESASLNGSLFITVFDANGQPVPGADVTIVNASTTPAIDFSDITDDQGRLQLVDVPTSTQGYQVSVTKDGYSSERTYQPGASGNPNPVKPHATVGMQTVTELSFAIDKLADVPVSSSDARCVALPNAPFTITGGKLVGTAPDVVKYAFTGSTGAGGVTTQQLEWDTYAFAYTGALDLAGTVPYQPVAIAPSSTQPFRFVLAPANGPSLLVATVDATGQPVQAHVTLSGPTDTAASSSLATYQETDWDPGSYASASNVADGPALTLAPAGGPYPTSTVGTLESQTIDLGGASGSLAYLSWVGSGGSGSDPIRFQVAGSDDGSGWNFVGPDGSGGSYFTGAGAVPASVSGRRYVRYKVFLQTDSEVSTPSVSSVSLEFSGPCVPPGQRLFQGLGAGSYGVSAAAPGYVTASSTVSVSGSWQKLVLTLDPS